MIRKCSGCHRRFLTSNRLAAHDWQCSARLSMAVDWMLRPGQCRPCGGGGVIAEGTPRQVAPCPYCNGSGVV